MKKGFSWVIIFIILVIGCISSSVSYAEEFNNDISQCGYDADIINKISDAVNNYESSVDITQEYNKHYIWQDSDKVFRNLDKDIQYVLINGDNYGFVDSLVTSVTSGNSVIIKINYCSDIDSVKQMKAEVDNEVKNFKENYIEDDYTDFQKEMAVVDYIDKICEYDDSFSRPYIFSAYGALINKKAVCEGYAKAADILFKACNLECCIATSKEADHAWNKVKIDGKYYNVDCTFADGAYDYTNVNVTDSKASEIYNCTDFLNDDILPKCTSMDFNYFNSSAKRVISEDYNEYKNCIYSVEQNRLFTVNDQNLISSDIYGNDGKTITSDASSILCEYKNNLIYEDKDKNIVALNLENNNRNILFKVDGYFTQSYYIDNILYINFTNYNNEDCNRQFNLDKCITEFQDNTDSKNDQNNDTNNQIINSDTQDNTNNSNNNQPKADKNNNSDNLQTEEQNSDKEKEDKNNDKTDSTDTVVNNEDNMSIDGDSNNIVLLAGMLFLNCFIMSILIKKKLIEVLKNV